MESEFEYTQLLDLFNKVYSGRANVAEIDELMGWLRDERKEKRLKAEALSRRYQQKNKAKQA